MALGESERLIDSKEFDRALARYTQVTHHLHKDRDLGDILAEQATRVYQKLQLYTAVGDALRAQEQRDISKLKQGLEHIRSIAAMLGEQQTPLLQDAKERYATMVRALNTLEIEHGGGT